MGDIVSYVFVMLVVAVWVYAGYRTVRVSDRKYATLRYVSPLLLLAVALVVYALWPSEAGAEQPELILTWVLPPAVILLVAAVVIDRRRARDTA